VIKQHGVTSSTFPTQRRRGRADPTADVEQPTERPLQQRKNVSPDQLVIVWSSRGDGNSSGMAGTVPVTFCSIYYCRTE
jgi:hypothetical protein